MTQNKTPRFLLPFQKIPAYILIITYFGFGYKNRSNLILLNIETLEKNDHKFYFIFDILLPLCSSRSSINSNDFCKSTVCSPRTAPHIFPCGYGICVTNQTVCIKYQREEKIVKTNRPDSFFHATLMSVKSHFNEKKIKEGNLRRFQASIKNCTKLPYEWQPKDMCSRGKNCFRIEIEYARISTFSISKKIVKNKSLKQTICPYPKLTRPYVCGSQSNYCSANKEACDSFSIQNAAGLQQISSIQKCENDYKLI